MALLPWRGKKLRMCWVVSRGEARSLLAGTSHFFPHSLRDSIRGLLADIDTVLLEGPLDRETFDRVVNRGFAGALEPSLYEALDDGLIGSLNSVLFGEFLERTGFATLMGMFSSRGRDPLYSLIHDLCPWMAFFTIWTHYLDQRGWKHSVDLDALAAAREMGKEVLFLETVEEHLSVLQAIPLDRIVHFLRMHDRWERFISEHVRRYLSGDLEGQMALSRDFPSRCDTVIDARDPLMYERMRPYFERGRAAAFVGTPHTKNILSLFRRDGFVIAR